MSDTPEEDPEVIAKIRDRLLGGPEKRMRELAAEMHWSYADLMEAIQKYLDEKKKIDTFEEIPDLERFWADYELLTGRNVSLSISDLNPFECCA